MLILLHRLADAGISLGGLNPFLWSRRRHWEQKFSGNPIFQTESPMELDGDMSAEQKSQILSAFEDEFKLNKKESAISSNYLLGRGDDISEKLDAILKPSLPNFTQAQAESAVKLLQQLNDRDMEPNTERQAFSTERQVAVIIVMHSNSVISHRYVCEFSHVANRHVRCCGCRIYR